MPSTEFFMQNEPTRFNLAEFNRMLLHSESHKASDITLQTSEPIIADIYGRLRHVTNRKLSQTEVGDLINEIYGPNGTAQLLSGNDIDTHYEFRPTRTERYRYRVNATACMVEGFDAIQITMRTIPTTPPKLETLGLPDNILQACEPHDGCVYVTGSTGSGKSTLLASIIRDIAENENSHRKILTYEAPIEFVYDEIEKPSCIVSQSEIPRHLPSFAAGVRNALRRTPRLILVGESRDKETIAASIEAALTGHPVYTTLHTTGVPETIRRLVTTFPPEERAGRTIDIIETMRLCIWQQLVPTVDGKRLALREFLVFDEDVRNKLLAVPTDQITDATRQVLQECGQTMVVDAQNAFDDGLITQEVYDEVMKLQKDK